MSRPGTRSPAESWPAERAATVSSWTLAEADGQALARRAAEVVCAVLGDRPIDGRVPAAAALRRLGASFVTLERDGALRGCIGTLEPIRPLYRDVAHNAGRATADPRLPRVTAREWPRLRVNVSVLSRSEPISAASLDELLATLRPAVDGLTLADGERRSTFLPAVWHKLPRPEDFVAALLRKGGWPTHRLPGGMRICRYTAVEFAQAPPHEPR